MKNHRYASMILDININNVCSCSWYIFLDFSTPKFSWVSAGRIHIKITSKWCSCDVHFNVVLMSIFTYNNKFAKSCKTYIYFNLIYMNYVIFFTEYQISYRFTTSTITIIYILLQRSIEKWNKNLQTFLLIFACRIP